MKFGFRTRAPYAILSFIFMTMGGLNWAYAKRYCRDLFPKPLISRFAIDPSKAVVGVFKGKVTAEDMVAEFTMLPASGKINRVEKTFRRRGWNEFNGPVSVRVREFLYRDKEFRKFSEGKNFKVRLRIQYFEPGDYADDVDEFGGLHVDHFYRAFSEEGTDIYIFNLSPGPQNIAPTIFYTGPEVGNLEELIWNAGLSGAVSLPERVSAFLYPLGNGELMRMSGHTLHGRSAARSAGYRYFLEIQDSEDYN